MGSQDLLVTLGYGASAEEAPVVVPQREHWGHWPLVRRRIGSSSTAYAEEFIEDVEEELEQVVVKGLPPDWNRILDDALTKVQAKVKAQVSLDTAFRKKERGRLAALARKEFERLEDEEAAIAFLLME